MNITDHEDAFSAANRCAADKIDLVNVLKRLKTREEAVTTIEEACQTYSNLFDAFIEGVEHGRRNPKILSDQNEIPF